ncbi:amidophosphoribosyltransferase [Clostridium aminobutyricum]|uniref:Amidophosphoribosyltransferase n=1 Tax=Clostridium aminobutyricum TaxID=33953 RepID=A0A939D8J6_CLOAM|nr:amidophosphoribosyltransferase [Clostridium aminobutyricum]MBN7773047.1 amidophosphoribosyltransferase [Clostridium aminobutyricum]
MGGLFGAVSKNDIVMDLFFGTDYHSHLGTKTGGMCVFGENGFSRAIHSIENGAFRNKFEREIGEMKGSMGIGSISDGEPQPLTAYSQRGHYAVGTVGRINNKEQLVRELLNNGCNQFMAMSGGQINNTELVASLISTGRTIAEGIRTAQKKIDGSCTMLVLTPDGLYAARDKFGRTPLIIGQKEDGYCVASESFSFINIGYKKIREVGPGEIVLITPELIETVGEAQEEMRICTFLWTYFGYPTAVYEGENVEKARHRNGALLAEKDGDLDVDYVAGVPDSGVAHALGYANKSGIPYARPLIKYTPTWPRSFMPQNQKARNLIAKMKLVPVFEIIHDKKFVLVDDSIVRGTQLSETVTYLHENGAKEIHVRSACPPIMYGCKYLNFSRSVSEMDLIARRVICELENLSPEEVTGELVAEYASSKTQKHADMVERIREKLNFNSLRYQDLEDTLEAIGIDRCKLCTYCWNGKE